MFRENKTLILFSLIAFSLSACTSKHLIVTEKPKALSIWNKVQPQAYNKYDNSFEQSQMKEDSQYSKINFSSGNEIHTTPYNVQKDHAQKFNQEKLAKYPNIYLNKTIYKSKIAVQIGAFSQYDKAVEHGNKLGRLYDPYHIQIESIRMYNKLIHRVHVRGFYSTHDANNFIKTYHLNNAFLVKY